MRRGIVLSLLMHFFLGIFIILELPTFVMPEKEINQINVKLVSLPSQAKKDVPAAKPKPVVTQQSAAPKYEPKKQKEVKQEVKHKTQVVEKTDPKKVVKQQKKEAKKEQPKQQEAVQEPKKEDIRPEKLDKSNKKSVVKSNDTKAKPNKVDDDFLSALDFADNIETDEKPSVDSDEDGEPSVYDVDQLEIAKIKRKIQANWFVTAGSNKLEKLETVVRLSLERDGTIRKVRVVSSSGKPSFDRSLQRAIRKSSPLPIPADKYEVYKTIELRFKR